MVISAGRMQKQNEISMAHYVLKYNNWQTKILDGDQKMTKMLSAVIRFALPSCSLQHGIAISKK